MYFLTAASAIRESSFYMRVYFVLLVFSSRDYWDFCIQKDRLRNQICRLERFTLYVNLSFNITYIHQVDKRLLFQKSSNPQVNHSVAKCIRIQQSVSKSTSAYTYKGCLTLIWFLLIPDARVLHASIPIRARIFLLYSVKELFHLTLTE